MGRKAVAKTVKKIGGVTIKQVMQRALWSIEFDCPVNGRISETGTYAECHDMMVDNRAEFSDMSLLLTRQPVELHDFVREYERICANHGYMTVADAFEQYGADTKVWTKDEIRKLLQTNDAMVTKSLMKLYDCQTADEQNALITRHNNNIGFNGVDGAVMSRIAKWYADKKFLSPKQLALVRKKIVKYSGQLADIANGMIFEG